MAHKWEDIYEKLLLHKAEIDRTYKCLNRNDKISKETIDKHKSGLVEHFENIRSLLNVYLIKLTPDHKNIANNIFYDCRDRILKVSARRQLNLKIPRSLTETIDTNEISDEEETYSIQETKMSQTTVEFLKTASSLLPDFDGRFENLQSFIDALQLINSIKETHEAVAISLIKTKLKGTSRNLITNETSLDQIITTLRSKVKGESAEVVTAKLMNLKQKTKTANQYTKEVEELTRALEGAYISDGMTNELASKYSTRKAVEAMTKNCSMERVKLIMEAGNFNDMNEAISKFVNICPETDTNSAHIMHFNSARRGNYYNSRRYNRGQNRQQTSYYRHNNRRQNNANANYNRYRGNRYNNNRYRNNRESDNLQNVRVTHSENDQTPLSQ